MKYPIFNLPLQYRITKNRSRLLRTEPPAYLLRPGVHLFQRHLRRTITKSVYIAIISRLVGYFLNNARRIFPKRHIFVLGLLLFSRYVTQRKLSAWLLARSPSIWSIHGLLSGFGMKAAATNLCNRNVLRIPLHKATVLYLFPEPLVFNTNYFLTDFTRP